MQDIIIVCEDLFGLEVYSILQEINDRKEKEHKEAAYRILGYISDQQKPFGKIDVGLQRLGSLHKWKPTDQEQYVLGIADPESKIEAVELLKGVGAKFATIIAPWMLAPSGLDIGEGSIISAYSAKIGIKIGKFVTVIGAMLSGHEIDDYSAVMRFSNIAGGRVGKSAYVGNHAFLALNKNIGDDSYVSDGSIIVRNVKPITKVSGVPAKRIEEGKK